MRIIRDDAMNESSHLAALEVRYPDRSEWDIAAFEQLRDHELDAIRKEGGEYDRETWFRQDAYFRYFRKFKKTYPVMMQVESFLLKGRPFPEGRYINAVAFLTELKTHILMGTHDADRVTQKTKRCRFRASMDRKVTAIRVTLPDAMIKV